LEESISFIYKAPFENGLTEHEFDYILIGKFNDNPNPNPKEVASWKWVDLEDLKIDIATNPSLYTAWFKIIFEKHYQNMLSKN